MLQFLLSCINEINLKWDPMVYTELQIKRQTQIKGLEQNVPFQSHMSEDITWFCALSVYSSCMRSEVFPCEWARAWSMSELIDWVLSHHYKPYRCYWPSIMVMYKGNWIKNDFINKQEAVKVSERKLEHTSRLFLSSTGAWLCLWGDVTSNLIWCQSWRSDVRETHLKQLTKRFLYKPCDSALDSLVEVKGKCSLRLT